MIRVEDVKAAEKKKGYVLVSFSDGKELELSEEAVYKYGLYTGAEFSPQAYEDVIFHAKADEAYKEGLLFVYRKLRTRKEVELKLVRSGHEQRCIEEALAMLEERGYLNDEVYAEKYVRTNIKTTKKSSRFIAYELAQKGVDEETSKKILEKYKINDKQRALDLLRKKFGPEKAVMKNENEDMFYKVVAKMKRYLYNKGFDEESVKFAIEKITGKMYDDEY